MLAASVGPSCPGEQVIVISTRVYIMNLVGIVLL